jgi:hypothetical protein
LLAAGAVRVNGRPVKRYLGTGDQAEEAARQVEERRQQRQAERKALQLHEARIAEAERVTEMIAFGDMLLKAVLLASGYRYRRGRWRKPRKGKTGPSSPGPAPDLSSSR